MQAYKEHLVLIKDDNADRLDETITLLEHTSRMIHLFSDKHYIYNVNDVRLQHLNEALQFFTRWLDQVKEKKNVFSDKLWFDPQSMIIGFCACVGVKLHRFPRSIVKPAIMNQDIVENHFSQLRGAHGQNENPTFLLTQATQNTIIFGQTTISQKGNTAQARFWGIRQSYLKDICSRQKRKLINGLTCKKLQHLMR